MGIYKIKILRKIKKNTFSTKKKVRFKKKRKKPRSGPRKQKRKQDLDQEKKQVSATLELGS